MNVRRAALLITLFAIAAAALGPSPASATTVEDAVTGLPLSTGTTIQNTGSDAVFVGVPSLGGITCADTTMSLTLGANHAPVVTATLDSFTLTNCTDTLPVVTYSGCHAALPFPTVTLVGTGTTGGTITFKDLYLRCNVQGTTSGCYWLAGTAAGAFTNATSTLSFTNVSTTHSVPPGGSGDLGSLCGSTGTLSMTLTHLVAPSLSNHTVRLTG